MDILQCEIMTIVNVISTLKTTESAIYTDTSSNADTNKDSYTIPLVMLVLLLQLLSHLNTYSPNLFGYLAFRVTNIQIYTDHRSVSFFLFIWHNIIIIPIHHLQDKYKWQEVQNIHHCITTIFPKYSLKQFYCTYTSSFYDTFYILYLYSWFLQFVF